MTWRVSPGYPRDVIDADGKLICTTYGSEAEANAVLIVGIHQNYEEFLRERQRLIEGSDPSPEATK